MPRTTSLQIQSPTAGDTHPSEEWLSVLASTTTAAITREIGSLAELVQRDYVDRDTAATYGIPGPANSITIGEVEAAATPGAWVTGTAPQQTLGLRLPYGPRGPQGPGGAYTLQETAVPGIFKVADTPKMAYTTTADVQATVSARAWDRGVLPNGADFNATRRQGAYTVPTAAAAATMLNAPSPRPGILRVESNDGASMTIQSYETYVSTTDEPGRFIRSSLSSSNTSWSPWTSKKWVNGALPDGTNLQTFRVPGAWMVPSTTSAATMVALPVNSPGVIEVLATRDTSRSMQRFTVETSGSLEVYARTSGTTSSMPAWTKVSGGVQSTTITSSSAFIGSSNRLYVVVAGVMRNDGTGWQALDDTIHRHANVESTTTGSDVITVSFPNLKAKKVVSFVCTPDETLTRAGYSCAASVSLTDAAITLARVTPMADYVQYNPANGGWTSLNGVFRNFSFSNGTLTMEHDPIGGSNFMDFQVTSRGNVLASGSMQAGGSTQTVTKIDFRDYAGALIATQSTELKAYVSRGTSGAVDPTTVTTTRYPASNIWFQGIFEL